MIEERITLRSFKSEITKRIIELNTITETLSFQLSKPLTHEERRDITSEWEFHEATLITNKLVYKLLYKEDFNESQSKNY